MERKSSRIVVLVLTGHVLAAAWTWRDIRQQPAQQVRGSKTFWRISSAVNRRAEHPVRRGNQPWNAYHRKQAIGRISRADRN
jgi:hypothetical protein